MAIQFLHFQSCTGDRLLFLDSIIEVMPMVGLEYKAGDGNELYRGLLHFRGQIIPVFDVEEDQTSIEERLNWFLIVVEGEETTLAIVAREVYGIMEVEEEDYSELDTGGANPILVVKWNEQSLRVIDPDLVAANAQALEEQLIEHE